ncbi:MAG: ABC transporter substrate-binding protein [Mariprofundus sp.]
MMRKYCLCLLVLLCGSWSEYALATAAGHEVRLQLKWKHQFQFAGYYAALEKGFYADEGLDVRLIEGGPDHAPVQELLDGDVQYAVGDAGALLTRAEGYPVVVVASIFQHSPQVIYTLADVKSLQDLFGKRVMMQHGNLTIEVKAMLEHAGLSRPDYVRIPIGSLEDLVAGRTDAWPGYSTNEGFVLKQLGIAFQIFRPLDYGIDFYGDALLTTEAEVVSHPERVAALRRATIRGWKYALAHKPEIIALIKKKYDSQHKSVAHLTYEASAIEDLMFQNIVPIGFSNMDRWHEIAAVFENMGQPVTGMDWDGFLYQPKRNIIDLLWQYRYWVTFVLLLLLLLVLYLYTVQLRRGIRRRTAALEKVSSEYKEILDHMQDAYYRTNLKGELTWVSLACERQMGYERHELIGQQLSTLYYERGGRERFLQALEASGGNLQHYEVCLRHKDGSRLWSEVNSQFFFDEQGNIAGVEGNVRNINERKRSERESRELTDQLQQAQKMESIGVLAGGIAHDFNNLLVGVMGNAELAMLDNRQDDLCPYLEQIFKSARRGADLVRQMLAYSGQGHISMGEHNFNELIRDVSGLLGTVIGKQITLEQELMDALPDIYGDKNQLTQLIMNLMTNASDAMHNKPGSILLRTGIRHLSAQDFSGMYMATEAQAGEYVFIEVKDSGCGMDKQTQLRIFDPFFTTKETGSGLGLAALLGIVRSHGGTLTLTSKPGKGSCFTIFFPALSSVRPAIEVNAMEQGSSPDLSGTVLLVDDEETVRHVARTLLEREGIEVLVAENGKEAVRMFRQHADRIALVLMDLTMPEMDGEQAFHAIRAIRPDARVILSSGFSESEAVERLHRYGLAGFIRKPYTRKVLLAQITHLGVYGFSSRTLES